jgi:HK97 gp10 family phage protein
VAARRGEVEVVYNRIPELLLRVKVGTPAEAHKMAKVLQDDAQSRLQPGSFGYDTGHARDSIEGQVRGRWENEVWLWGGGDLAPYFVYNEYGTRHRAAAPSLTPAFEAHKDEWSKNIGDLVQGFH